MGEPKSANPARMPSDETSEMLLQVYWSKFHAKYPFLSRNEILDLNKRRHELSAHRDEINTQELHSSPRPVRATSRKLHLSLFKLNMIYAISARYVQLRQSKEAENTPEEYYNAASREIDAVLSVKDLDTIDSLLLLVLYQLRSPSYPGMWHLIRHAMTSSVETGLHRKARIPSLVENERRKRLFWCVYSLDRAVAMALGRPHSISERDIDTDLPANVDDDIDDEATLRQAINDSISFPKRSTKLSAAIHQIRLKIIESRIHETLYSVRRPDTVPADEIAILHQQLLDWKENIPDSPQMDSEEQTHRSRQMHLLHYYKSIRLLYLPRINSFESSPQEFQRCIDAAGQICQLQKQIHHTQTVAWSLLGLHATYLAGLTLIYGFYLSRSIFDFKFSSDIRACSTVLYIIAERWPAAAKYRDAFEELVANLIEADQQQSEPSSSSKEATITAGNEASSSSTWPVDHDLATTPAAPDFSSAFNPPEQGGWLMQDPYFHPVAASHAFGGVAGEQAWEMFEDLIDKNFRHQVKGIHLGIPTYFAPYS
ncbi:hypothetical protein BP5796_05613 [Coleophoma crateriformis]|uniref:Xylanolytic transcriptional activator regulatory domain-containing protein n=1 Tax=Coleophoma crateriformis TaxID=565419 RepID=A0A3D8S3S0_9HELO|nr:hypothetical protein BP5796_05613 [Coleophoma crateriformis]